MFAKGAAEIFSKSYLVRCGFRRSCGAGPRAGLAGFLLASKSDCAGICPHAHSGAARRVGNAKARLIRTQLMFCRSLLPRAQPFTSSSTAGNAARRAEDRASSTFDLLTFHVQVYNDKRELSRLYESIGSYAEETPAASTSSIVYS